MAGPRDIGSREMGIVVAETGVTAVHLGNPKKCMNSRLQ
jgi:hypothetical protein